MKQLLLIILIAFNCPLFGQNFNSDSLNKALRSDASWAIRQGEYSKAKVMLDSLIMIEPHNAENYFVESLFFYYQKKTDSIIISLNKALELGHDSMRVYKEFYRYYTFKQKDINKCFVYINKMIEMQPNNPDHYMERSSLKVDLGDFDGSWSDIEMAAKLGNVNAKEQIDSREKDTERLRLKGIIK